VAVLDLVKSEAMRCGVMWSCHGGTCVGHESLVRKAHSCHWEVVARNRLDLTRRKGSRHNKNDELRVTYKI
jgi:hypothetical protein